MVYILHLVDFMLNVGKYTSPMDPMGNVITQLIPSK